ncbi:MAG: DUF7694 domain-containing protein [Acidimicrobiia bacterium]
MGSAATGAGPKPLTRQRSAWEQVDAFDGVTIWRRRVSGGALAAIVAREPLGPGGMLRWHLSISHATNHQPPRPGRYPSYDEQVHAIRELLPKDRSYGMIIPPDAEYVAVHPTTFHWHELAESTWAAPVKRVAHARYELP